MSIAPNYKAEIEYEQAMCSYFPGQHIERNNVGNRVLSKDDRSILLLNRRWFQSFSVIVILVNRVLFHPPDSPTLLPLKLLPL